MLLTQELEFEIMRDLIDELSSVTDGDDNKSIFMKEFTFFDYSVDHILNAYRFNMEKFVDVKKRIDRYSISFFDYAEWYYYSKAKYNAGMSNNPCNDSRYYCSRNTGPAWNVCRAVAGMNIGDFKEQKIGPSICRVEKVSDTMLKYTEEHNNFPVMLNHGAGCIFWQFRYEPYLP